MKRTTPLRAKSQIKRGGPIKPKKRSASEFARIYGSLERVQAIKALACYACFKAPAENAHTESGGMGRKAGYEVIADLCASCHRTGRYSLHNLGSVEAFDRHWGTDLRARAAFLAEFLKP